MSKYYNPNRTRNLYNKNSKELFRLSRGRIDNFIACPRCFYLDRKLGVAQPPGYPFSLNSAVDKLLKKEFDIHRAKGTTHPLMKTYGIDAIPLAHEKMVLKFQIPDTLFTAMVILTKKLLTQNWNLILKFFPIQETYLGLNKQY